MSKLLSKDDILKREDIVAKTVEVPEWGGEVMIRTMTGQERDAFEDYVVTFEQDRKKKGGARLNLRAELLSRCIVDGDGNLLFTEPADIVALGGKSGKALDRCFKVAQELSRFTDKDLDELEGNSGTVPEDDTTSI